ncbi:MAG: 50S ribosomal protein L9 [Gammaproteobacteria bacterium]|nr:50S ribosomal protein L9 [Gammaproteobacteria bacterium]MDH3411838.1 50S ribosomal protein L9 [Gammaproteobacteria bacterium]
MQIILLEAVENLGKLGDTVKVKPGYARNFLLPQGKAMPATKENLAEVEARRAELERQEMDALAAAKARAEQLEGREVSVARKAGDEGKLFGSVGTADISEALAKESIEVERHEIRLPADNIRQVGDYSIGVHLHAEVETTITLHVIAEEGP